MHPRTKITLVLGLLTLVDWVVPLPILGLLLLYVVWERPAWFRGLVVTIYPPTT